MPVSFFEDEEEEQYEDEPDDVKRKTRQRRPPMGRSPLARVLIILAAVVILVLIMSLGIKSCLDRRKVSEYNEYFDAVAAVVKDSDDIGKQLSDMFQNPNEEVRASLEGKLGEFQAASDQIVERAKAVKAPDEFQQKNEWFVASMQFRARGLKGLQPALLNALQAKDNQAGAAQVSHEMLILAASDVAYEEFFYNPAQQVLKDEKITEIKVPQSKFLKDIALASQQTSVTVLERLKGGPAAEVTGLHGVALVGVKAKPSGMDLVLNSDNSLKASDALTFEVEVENQGEATEENVTVSLTLTAPGHPSPQKVDGQIPSIAPGERKTIELTGLAAEAGPQVAILRAECGPVPGEVNTQNNSGEFNILFD
jgi:hypothetical protein